MGRRDPGRRVRTTDYAGGGIELGASSCRSASTGTRTSPLLARLFSTLHALLDDIPAITCRSGHIFGRISHGVPWCGSCYASRYDVPELVCRAYASAVRPFAVSRGAECRSRGRNPPAWAGPAHRPELGAREGRRETAMSKVKGARLRQLLEAQGFDACYRSASGGYRVGCSQCEALVINGVATHELGCPHARHECRGWRALIPVPERDCAEWQ